MKRKMLALLLGFLMLAGCAAAETAVEITTKCVYRGKNAERLGCMTDNKYKSSWLSEGGKAAKLDIEAPDGSAISGVFIQFYNVGSSFILQTQDAAGQWQDAAACGTDFLTGYAQLSEAAQKVRVIPGGTWGQLSIAEIHVFAEGDVPDWVQRWEAPLNKADMLVISTHPDDELLFLGGTIPYYAGERKLDVQVAYLVPATPYRKLELLDGLWYCGVRNYPDIGTFQDHYSMSPNGVYEVWGKRKAQLYITGLYRRYQPEVVVTQDVNGEYGHGAHKAVAELAQECIAYAADENWQKNMMKGTEPWQIKKLYLHLYPDGALEMDWRQPLSAFGGRTAFDVAAEAFQCHVSQLHTDYAVLDEGELSCARFGLAYSAVGADEAMNDFMEHID